jgi:glycosyltransferase involved in cell wall biosynthesis
MCATWRPESFFAREVTATRTLRDDQSPADTAPHRLSISSIARRLRLWKTRREGVSPGVQYQNAEFPSPRRACRTIPIEQRANACSVHRHELMTDATQTPDTGATTPELSVVIAAHNAAATLPEQLEALGAEQWAHPWEIVLVDNASTDATRTLAEQCAAGLTRLRIVDARTGRGPAHARNVGASQALGRSLAFCDSDDVIAQGWVRAMGEALRDHEFVSGPLELRQLNAEWLAESRGSTGANGLVWFDGVFPFASSCNFGIRRERFRELGGFDEALHVGEDIELSYRLSRTGVDLHYEPAAVVHYRYRPTLRATFDQARAYGASRPRIAERLRTDGAAVSQWHGARNWAWLAKHANLLGTQAGRARWLWVAGQRVGNLQGSLEVRRLYL